MEVSPKFMPLEAFKYKLQLALQMGRFNFKVWHPRCVLITVYKEWIK